ncbi:MAG: polyprenyl synthetase family protein [Bacteroidales bacterium]|nr:polyprenyl synthetase family protein [Bacteroidales bacterium]
MDEIKAYLQPGLEQVNVFINMALRSDIPLLDSTNRSLREHPGKMMRPMLALLVADAAGEAAPPPEDTYRYAAATELLHNATLLHDDVVDGATERRGLPTVASILGGSTAVLIGDYWLEKCLQLVLGARREADRVLRLFAQTIGHLTEGELLQMQKASTADTTQADYLRIIYGKTASLFESAAMSAAISVAASEELIRAMGDYAYLLGLAFQIKDDIFDYEEEAADIGKPVGIDLMEQKITQPLLCVLEKASSAEQQEIRSLVKNIPDHPENVDRVRAFVKENDGVALAKDVMDFYVEKAISCLESLPESKEKLYLAKLARFVGQRDK